jgi:UDP-N-acetylmuramoyl-L-alanyl-D-glutamate--2,6-diaminopimelate ligase
MVMDNFERFGVTADWKKVLPGMIYVDLQENRNRRDIYNAYNNGASVIFTAHNISDPALPVIKVNNAYETMLLMLNQHFHSPQNKLKLIAISGSNDKDVILDLLYKILEEKSLKVKYEEKEDFLSYFNSLKNLDIEDIYNYFNRIASKGEHYMPIIVDYRLKYFRFINSFKFDSALITGINGVGKEDSSCVLGGIRSFVSQIYKNKPIILNNEDDMILKALEGSKNSILITYGLNKKAAVTATSIDVNQQTTFNYCLQRSFISNSGRLIEPFEMPIGINMLGSRCIHNALGVITSALYYDIDIDSIKKAMKTYVAPGRRYEMSVVGEITLLDNYCSTPGDLDKTLESIQLLNYNKLILMLSISKNEDWQDVSSVAKVISQWNNVLNISEVILCGCIDINENITPYTINDIRKIKKLLKLHLTVKYFDELLTSMDYLTETVKENDMVILAGGDELNGAKEMFKQQLEEKAKNSRLF